MRDLHARNAEVLLNELIDSTASHFRDALESDFFEREREIPLPIIPPVQLKIKAALRERALCMKQPFYDSDVGQQMLARILRRIATRKTLLGCNLHIARLAAAILAFLRNETMAYKVFMVFYEQLCLDDYFAVPPSEDEERFLEEDVENTLIEINTLWPQTLKKFEDLGCLLDLHCILRGLLRSLLMQGYQEASQPFVHFIPLLHRLITSTSPPDDPRKFLRHAAACVVGRHFQEIEACLDAVDLRTFCDCLGNKIQVDITLMRLLEAEFDTHRALSTYGWGQVPSGAAAGGLVAMPLLAGCSVPLIGLGFSLAVVCGAAVTYNVGWISGTRCLAATVQEFITETDNSACLDDAHDAIIDANETPGRSLLLHLETRAPGAEVNFPMEDEDPEEDPLFEGSHAISAPLERELENLHS